MKWYHSLKFKNSLFFLLIGSLFVVAMMLFFTNLKEQRLVERAESAVILATNDVVRELLLAQLRNEQIVEDMADVASVHKVNPLVVKKMLTVPRKNEIVSGGLWFEPYTEDSDKEAVAYFYQRNNSNDFVLIDDYEDQSATSYRNMEFYVLAKHLKEGETFWTKAYRDPVTKVNMITVVAPIYREHKFIGVASLDVIISLKQRQIFSHLIDSKERYFLLADRVGELLIYSKKLASIGISEHSLVNDEVDIEKYAFLNFLSLGLPTNNKSALAEKLLNASADFTPEEAGLLAFEIEHKANGHQEKLKFHSEIIEDDPVFHEPSVLATFYFPHTSWHMVIAIPEHVILKDTIAVYDKIMTMTAIFAILAALMGYLLIRRSIVKPLEYINKQIKRSGSENQSVIICNDKSEIGELVESLNLRNFALNEAHEREQQNEILLLQQSKMAAMGEMLDAVAHQWKQPLNALSMYTELINIDFKSGEVDQAYIEQFQKDVETQINHMTNTLGTFRSFFRPSKELQYFDLYSVIEDVLLLAKDELNKNTIEVHVEEKTKLKLYGSENEFKHLLLNIINNAKDAFIENDVKERIIIIRLLWDQKSIRMEIEDSAGGVPESVIENVFKAHFTTKKEGKGTGIGLYMSEQIAHKHHAKLSVENREMGACFIVAFSELSFKA